MAEAALNSGYISKATLRNVRVSPRKARLVIDMIRGKDLGRALDSLRTCDKKTARLVEKLIMSAAANAKESQRVDVDELFVKRAWVDGGFILYRFMPRAHGRATKIRKRHSTITVVLDERA